MVVTCGSLARTHRFNPDVKVFLEIVNRTEGINTHSTNKVSDTLSYQILARLQECKKRRHPWTIIGTRKHSTHNIDDRAKAESLVAAVFAVGTERKQHTAFFQTERIGCRITILVLNPTLWSVLAFALQDFQFTHSRCRSSEIGYQIRLFPCRECNSDRVSTQHFLFCKRRSRRRRCVCRGKTNHIVRQRHHSVIARNTEMVRVIDGNKSATNIFRLFYGDLHCFRSHNKTKTVVTVNCRR